MIENLVCISKTLADPDETGTLGAAEAYFYMPVDLTIHYISVAPRDDDTGATLDIDDDASGVITGIACADADVPGTWKSKSAGGTNTPVTIAKGSLVNLGLNNAAAANVFQVDIWGQVGAVWG